MINLFQTIKCLFVGHKLQDAGACPFTGKHYRICTKCMATLEI